VSILGPRSLQKVEFVGCIFYPVAHLSSLDDHKQLAVIVYRNDKEKRRNFDETFHVIGGEDAKN